MAYTDSKGNCKHYQVSYTIVLLKTHKVSINDFSDIFLKTSSIWRFSFMSSLLLILWNYHC